MSSAIWSPRAVAVALCVLVSTSVSRAEEAPTTVPAGVAATGVLGVRAVPLQALARQRGGTDTGSLSDMKRNGVVTDNHASNLTTGSNLITDGALSGASGVPLVVQNSGNNVLIQSATIINVTVR